MPLNTEFLPIRTAEEQSALTEAPAAASPVLSAPPAAPSLPAPSPVKPPSGRSHLFQPGQSGNPSGRPKRTQEEKEALAVIRGLAPLAVEKLESLLKSAKVSAAVKVKICEIILDRTYGKAESAVRVTSAQETVEKSQSYILSLVERIRADMEDESL